MATYLGPLLLVLVGVGGLVVIFGRSLRDGRHVDVSGTRTERTATGSRRIPWAALARAALRSLLLGVALTWRFGKGIGRALGRLLQRPPAALRVPRIAFPAPQGERRVAREPSRTTVGVSAPASEPHRQSVEEPPVAEFVTREVSAVSAGRIPPREQEAVPSEGTPHVSVGTAGTASASDADSGRRLAPPAAPAGEERSPAATPEKRARGPERVTELEAHVLERVAGRRKVVGRVHAKSASAEKARKPVTPTQTGGREERQFDDTEKLLAQGNFVKAEEALVQRLSANPRDIGAYVLLGRVYIEKGEYRQAREALEEAARRGPVDPALYGLLGHVYVALGEYGNALQLYQRAHDADEQNVAFLEQLLAIAARMDRRPLVKVTAEKILLLNPEHEEAKKQLARVAAVT